MPLMYRKILVPVDGSDPSNIAIAHAVDLAKITQGKIDLIHVVDIADQVEVYTHFQSAHLPEDFLKDFWAIGDEVMNEASSHVPPELRGELLVKTGEPREFLQQFIEKRDYDLVIIGCRGLSTLPSLLLGSVSQYLVQHAPCPIMVVK